MIQAESVEAEAQRESLDDPKAHTAALQDELRRVAIFAERYRKASPSAVIQDVHEVAAGDGR